MNKINENGFWEGTDDLYNIITIKTFRRPPPFFENEKVETHVISDVIRKLRTTFEKNNIHVSGFDGNPKTPELTNKYITTDLSKPIKFKLHFLGLRH